MLVTSQFLTVENTWMKGAAGPGGMLIPGMGTNGLGAIIGYEMAQNVSFHVATLEQLKSQCKLTRAYPYGTGYG